MNKFEIFGYFGNFFAIIYRIPQILKIYKTKRGEDISKKTYILHNAAYLSFILYISFGKQKLDYILLFYYLIVAFENFIIICLKFYYKRRSNLLQLQIEEN